MSRAPAGLAAAVVVAGLISSGCGRDIEPITYDPPQEQSAGRWSTWVVGNPASIRVPPPPRAESAKAKADLRESRRVTRRRDLAGERTARYWALEPTVRPWLDAGLNAVTLGDYSPPAASRAYALLSVAMHDAAVATWHWKYVYRRKPPPGKPLLPRGKDPSYPSEHAAIAAAAARVLTYALGRPAGHYRRLARTAARSRVIAGTNFPSDAEAGLDLGRRVGDAVVARARRDGFGRRGGGARPIGRGFWEPPPGSNAAPVEPLAGSWRTWVLRSGSQLRPAAPAGFDSPAFRAQAGRVKAVGDRLTARQRRVASFWKAGEDTPLTPGLWNQIALSRIDRKGLSTPRAARLFA
ncbi:MAG: phosphatase PAP2 family protein, partial [Actinomycetota bacterium]|nr:phosphatase PAP2 family protein [Actinomycetota bacterium]